MHRKPRNVELALALSRPSKTYMRANAPFPALLALSGLVLLAPAAAFAVTHRAPAKAEHSSASKSSKAEAKAAKSRPVSAKAGKKAEPALKKTSSKKAAEKPEKPSKHGRGKSHAEPEAPALSRVSRDKNKHQRVEARPEPRLIASKKPAAPEPTRVAKLERTEPEPMPVGPEPHVQHNRKVHLDADAPQTPAAVPSVDPHHATSPSDLLNSGTAHPPTDDESQPMQKSIVELPGTPSQTPAKQTVSVVRLPLAMKEIPVIPPVETATVAPLPSPKLFNEHGRLIMPPPLKGSHEILVRQNVNADNDGLERIRDDEDLSRMRASGMLVALPLGEGLAVDERLPVDRRYARPWAARFLSDMSRAHYARFQTPLQVNSAVRTVQFQARLIHTNGNAAPFEGETASPHLTGQALDIAKKGLSQTEIAWMRGYLLPLIQQGKVDVEEEFQQSCFHISVYRKYMPSAAPKRIVVTHRGSATALAAAMQ